MRRGRMRRPSTVCALLLLLLGTAAAQAPIDDDPDVEMARRYFEDGTAHYQAGRYAEAASRFEAAQARHRAAELDYNLARCHDRMDLPARAILNYERYLAAKPDSAQASEIRDRIRVLRGRSHEASARRGRWLAPGLVGAAALALGAAGAGAWLSTRARLDDVGARWDLGPTEALQNKALALKGPAVD